jgi:iron(III) transport system substrate-binding protein
MRAASAVLLILTALASGCGRRGGPEVVLYSSCDDIYARPLIAAFESRTGIAVRAVYDTEHDKAVGLTNRLLAERARPRADVYWSSEALRTAVLARAGVFAPYRSPAADDIPAAFRDPQDRWTGFAARARVIVYNTHRVKPDEAPRRMADLADPRWKGRAGMGHPMTGTTAVHLVALRAARGPEALAAWMRAFQENGGRRTAGNAMVRDLVARAELDVGLTDTDDVWVGIESGKPVALVVPDQGASDPGCLVIPNAVALVAGGPHPSEGKTLVDYLLGADVEGQLAAGRSRQMPVRPAVEGRLPPGAPKLSEIKVMAVDYNKLAEDWEAIAKELRGLQP